MKDSIWLVVVALGSAPAALATTDRAPHRPNILWITAEDLSTNLGCYGDANARTPHLDRFAGEAVRFSNVFSVHPCCSPSRSCLATGIYPTRLGTFQHRGKVSVPKEIRCFPSLLREAGYYCFNGSQGGSAKLDYNFTPHDDPWNRVGSRQIEWRNCPPGQPFFGQINLARSHQSQYGKRAPGSPGKRNGLHEPAKIELPPYHPDLPAVREIWSEYHDRITEIDGQFAAILAQLEADGLGDDTIVFFFGDNGHGIPGGKVWLWDEGVHVPLVIRVPERWRHWRPAGQGGECDRLVSFVDFAPTVLALAGAAIPAAMQGQPFLGPEAGERAYAFAARDFHDGADFDTSRMVRSRRYHYIRNFMPQQGWDPIQYSWQQAPYMLAAWRQAAADGKLHAGTRQACFFRRTKPVEELYDVEHDRYQMRNLAGEPQYAAVLAQMRAECERWMVDNHDLGLLSQYELYTRSQRDSPYEMGADVQRNPVERLLEAANMANRQDPAAMSQLLGLLQADDSAVRRWGALGLLALRSRGASAATSLLAALKDPSPDVRMTAAEALAASGQADQATAVLIDLLGHRSRIICNETLLALCRIGPAAQAALPYLERATVPGEHSGLWSYDNIPEAVELARACLGGSAGRASAPRQAAKRGRPKRVPAVYSLKETRQKHLD